MRRGEKEKKKAVSFAYSFAPVLRQQPFELRRKALGLSGPEIRVNVGRWMLHYFEGFFFFFSLHAWLTTLRACDGVVRVVDGCTVASRDRALCRGTQRILDVC